MTFLSTKFEQQRRQEVTWRHHSGEIENQIDHIVTTKHIGKNTTNTRS